MDERKESPSLSLWSVWLCCQARGKQRAQTDHRLGRGGREEGASILTTLPHIALPSGHFILELDTWNIESHSEPTLI